jgi:type IV pilus assembly protein PilC
MVSFLYTARDGSGQLVNGTLRAESSEQAARALRAEGKYLTSLRRTDAMPDEPATRRTAGVRISRTELIQFSTQLAIMSETGVTLSEALECMRAQKPGPAMARLLDDLSTQVQGGVDFSAALARHPRTFPRLYIALMKASERSGMLARMLNRANAYLRDEHETVRRVKGALTYPAIMLTFAISTTVFLLTFVMPKFTAIYAAKGAVLPTPTRVLMAISNTLVDDWVVILCSSIGVIAMAVFYVRTPGGHRVFNWIELNTPLIGGMFRKLHLSRGMRMIGTMAGAGVSLMDCVSTANELCDNVYFRELWNDVSEKLQAGKQMSEPLGHSALVPRPIAQMIHSGEKGGKLAMVMEQVAGFSEQELKDTIAELTRYIEPLMIIVMGFIIGGVALALMLPIFTISRVIAR